ncbi:hypothetical protein [Colwellia sp. MEBiC06753]
MNAKIIISAIVGLSVGIGAGNIMFSPDMPESAKNASVISAPQTQFKHARGDDEISRNNKQNLQDEITRLTTEVNRLTALLEQQNSAEPDTHEQYLSEYSSDNESFNRMPYSDEQLLELLEQPYASMAAALSDESAGLFTKLYDSSSHEERDYVLEEKIRDFIVIHQLADHIELHGVKCEVSVCEVKGKEFEVFSWNKIFTDMQKFNIAAFISSYSTASNIDGDEYFYSLLAY